MKAWCISGTSSSCKEDSLYGTFNDFWIGIYDDNSKIKNKLVVKCGAYGGMASYNFDKFFDKKEIESIHDLVIQEKLLSTINHLIEEGILKKVNK